MSNRAPKKTEKTEEEKQNCEIDGPCLVKEKKRVSDKSGINHIDPITDQAEGQKNGIHSHVSAKSRKKPTACASRKTNQASHYQQDNMCHQCQKSDRIVERCQYCKRKRYCHQCLQTWYPCIAKEDIAKKCPICCNICNCRACLRKMNEIRSNPVVSDDGKIQSSKYILLWLLPHLKEINDEQNDEKEMEAKISGIYLLFVMLEKY